MGEHPDRDTDEPASEPSAEATGRDRADAADDAGEREPASDRGRQPDGDLPPVQALAKGLGLLWRAAQGTAKGVRDEVEQAGVRDAMKDAGRHLESAATSALRGMEQLVRAVGRPVSSGKGRAETGGEPASAEPTAPAANAEPEPTDGQPSQAADDAEPSDPAAGARISVDDD